MLNQAAGDRQILAKQLGIPNIKFIKSLGNGANGYVYLCEHEILNRKEAIKFWIPRKDKGRNEVDDKQFREETSKLAGLDCSDIIKVYDADIINNAIYYMRMEFFDGKTVRKWLKNDAPDFICRNVIMDRILNALAMPHDLHIYHGDMHCDNILINDGFDIKIIDYGTSLFCNHSQRRAREQLIKTFDEILGEWRKYDFFSLDNEEQLDNPEIYRSYFSFITSLLSDFENDCFESNFTYSDYRKREFLHKLSLKMINTPLFNISKITNWLKTSVLNLEIQLFYNLIGSFAKNGIKTRTAIKLMMNLRH